MNILFLIKIEKKNSRATTVVATEGQKRYILYIEKKM